MCVSLEDGLRTLSLMAGLSCRAAGARVPGGLCSICRMDSPAGEAVRQRAPAGCPAGDLQSSKQVSAPDRQADLMAPAAPQMHLLTG